MQPLLDAYIRYLIAEKNLSPFTLRNYRTDILDFTRYMDEHEDDAPLDADRHSFRRYLAYARDGGIVSASLARRVSTVRNFYAYLAREGHLESNPLAGVSSPKRERRLPSILTKDHLSALIAAADEQTPQGLRNRAILELMYAAGVRLSEIVALDLKQLDLAERTLIVRGKGNKERMVLIGDARVWRDDNVVTGERITIYLAEDRSVVEGGQQERVKAVFYPRGQADTAARPKPAPGQCS